MKKRSKKEIKESITFKYRELIGALQAKLRSGKLSEEQKIKIFFFVKSEEIKNMTRKDLERSRRKYERILASINQTIAFLEEQQRRKGGKRQVRLGKRVCLEKVAQRSCRTLLRKIEKKLSL